MVPTLFAKYVLLVLLTLLLYFCYKYPRQSILIKQDLFYYALKTKIAHFYNLFVLLIYINLFVIGIFSLRYLNKGKELDLIQYYNIAKNFLIEYWWHEFFISCLLIVLFIIIYILILYKLIQYFKLHLIKRHIYLVGKSDTYNWYNQMHQKYFWPLLINPNIYNKILGLIRDYYIKFYFSKKKKIKPENYDDMSLTEKNLFHKKNPASPFAFIEKYKIDLIILYILTKWHYVLLIFSILYDVKYNNLIITHFFYILPWIFFYDLYLRFCKFVNDIWLPYDQALHNIIYSSSLETIGKDTLLIDGEFHDLEFYQSMYKYYIARGFVKDPLNI